MIIINGEKCVLGRISTHVAKELLKGESVVIYNAEKIRVTGSPKNVVEKWVTRLGVRDIAKPTKSPHFSRRPDYFVKRVIRGMLPYRRKRGIEAYRRLRVFMEEPAEYSGKGIKIAELKGKKKSISVSEICKKLGWSS